MDNLREFQSQTGLNFTGSNFANTFQSNPQILNPSPERLGPYLLERELGRGFSAIVYQAVDTLRRRAVALKVLTFLQSLSEDRRMDMTRRFEREAQAISALSHPNIVAIFEFGHSPDGRQFIAMEHLRGETLRARLLRSASLSFPEAADITIRIADALHYAHGRGIIHRDVKPDNVFLADGSGESGIVPKLMDFGIAHILSDQVLTQDGTIVGSPAYMSPEQINGQRLDARTDVFSLAVMLLEMVTGSKPFEADTIPAVMQQILHHTPDLRRVTNRPLRQVIAKALAKDPDARYPDAAAFAAALRRAVPVAASAPSVATQIIQDAPRRTLPALSSRFFSPATLGLGGLALATVALMPLFAPRPAQLADQRPPRSSAALISPATPVSHQHWIAAAWHPAAPKPRRLTAILAAAPARHSLINYTPTLPLSTGAPLRIVHAAPATATTAAPLPPAAPAAPLPPARPRQPLLAASVRPAILRAVSLSALKPVIRVAGTQQEMTPVTKASPSTIPEAEPASDNGEQLDALPPPPRASGLPDALPHALHRTMPSLPADAPSALAGTTVRLRVSVNEDGDVNDISVLESSGSPDLDQAAAQIVRQWEYDPAIRDGQSVPGIVTEQVKFRSR